MSESRTDGEARQDHVGEDGEQDVIGTLLRERNWAALRKELASLPPPLVAILLPDFSKSERMILFRCLEREQAAEAFSFLNEELQAQLLTELTDQETRDILAGIASRAEAEE